MISEQKRIMSLDGLRCVSIILVLFDHMFNAHNFTLDQIKLSKYFFNGNLGVEIFFVLSGFLITHLLLKEEIKNQSISLVSFFKRRILRIFPVYYTFIFVMFLLSIYTKLDVSKLNFINAITFTTNLFPINWINGHFWSLCIEEQYYLLWPFLFKYLGKNKRMYICIFFILFCPIARAYLYLNHEIHYLLYSPLGNFDTLFIGSLTALIFENYRQNIMKILEYKIHLIRISAFTLIYIIWFLKLKLILGLITIPFGFTIQSICISYLILSYSQQNNGLGYKFLNNNLVAFIGRLSFSIYVWQQLFFVSPDFYTEDKQWFLFMPWNVIMIFIIAIISFYLIEKQFIKLKKYV